MARLIAFVVWAAVATSAMFWILRLSVSSPTAPAHTSAVSDSNPSRGDLARLFGVAATRDTANTSAAAQAEGSGLAARFRLLGVAAPRQGGDRDGLALIAVDGKPARGYAVGASVDGELILQSVHQRGARLGTRGQEAQVVLDLPALPPPATSSLTSPAQGFPSPRPVPSPAGAGLPTNPPPATAPVPTDLPP